VCGSHHWFRKRRWRKRW